MGIFKNKNTTEDKPLQISQIESNNVTGNQKDLSNKINDVKR